MPYRFALPALFLCFLVAAAIHPAAASATDKGTESAQEDPSGNGSGLPIPRFVSLKFEEVNLRTGPGTRYPIRWVYKKRHMPVEVIEEYGQWRKLRDAAGDEGWAHQTQLTGNRSVMFTKETVLKRYPETSSPPMIKVGKDVVAKVLECDTNWCEVQLQSYKAWVEKKNIWGVYPQEIL